MSNILITGSTGFIGTHLLIDLYKKNKIYLILRNKKKINNYKQYKNVKVITFTKFDELNNKLNKIKVDIIIHCATHYIKNHNYNDIINLAKSNILLGNVLLENLQKMKVKKFINFSTVWEDYNSIKDNNFNLYSAYKKSFEIITNYYKKNYRKIKFYNIMISDTFGQNDNRIKIVNVLRDKYKKNQQIKIASKNLSMNLLNVKDIISAINLILQKDIVPGKYLLKNKMNFKISNIINIFNKKNKKKLKVKWLSKKLIREKIYPYKKINGWNPLYSKIDDIINIIKE